MHITRIKDEILRNISYNKKMWMYGIIKIFYMENDTRFKLR